MASHRRQIGGAGSHNGGVSVGTYSGAYFVESSRNAALGHQCRILVVALVGLLGLIVIIFSGGLPSWSAGLLDEDGASAMKKQSSRLHMPARSSADTAMDADAHGVIAHKNQPTNLCNDGCLTTHVLDTANGIPAEGMRVILYRIHVSKGQQNTDEDASETKTELGSFTTNANGRIDGLALISEKEFIAGTYELIFYVSLYFDERTEPQRKHQDAIPFLSTVPIRFGVDDAAMHYHIPLLVSQYSYSTYRGS